METKEIHTSSMNRTAGDRLVCVRCQMLQSITSACCLWCKHTEILHKVVIVMNASRLVKEALQSHTGSGNRHDPLAMYTAYIRSDVLR